MVTKKHLSDKRQTSREMYRMVERYCDDLRDVRIFYRGKKTSLADLPLNRFYEFVKNLKYETDIKPVEIVARPLHILAMSNLGKGIDCKKKAILMAAYLRLRNVPYRFVASSNRPDGKVHHVFPQMEYLGQWLNVDATYAKYKPFQLHFVTNAEVL